MDIQQIALLAMIGISTVTGIIGAIKGNPDTIEKAEKTRQKALLKLQKKHAKTLKKAVKEETKINELKGEKENGIKYQPEIQ